jgi:hypothetical protein
VGTIDIVMTSGMDCPGGEWTKIEVNGVNKGRVYPDSNVTLGQVIQIVMKDYPVGTQFKCNSTHAKYEYLKIIS